MNTRSNKKALAKVTITVFFFVLMSSSPAISLMFSVGPVRAAHAQIPNADNPNSPGFRIVVCDGPTLPNITAGDKARIANIEAELGRKYVPCDFKGVMAQIQHIINLMLIVGVLAAIAMLTYSGYLYITGTQDNIKKAKSIFPKLAGGFALMLTAWFIVYQILDWLTDNGSGFSTLLGNP